MASLSTAACPAGRSGPAARAGRRCGEACVRPWQHAGRADSSSRAGPYWPTASDAAAATDRRQSDPDSYADRQGLQQRCDDPRLSDHGDVCRHPASQFSTSPAGTTSRSCYLQSLPANKLHCWPRLQVEGSGSSSRATCVSVEVDYQVTAGKNRRAQAQPAAMESEHEDRQGLTAGGPDSVRRCMEARKGLANTRAVEKP